MPVLLLGGALVSEKQEVAIFFDWQYEINTQGPASKQTGHLLSAIKYKNAR